MALCMHKLNARGRCTQFGLEVPETVTWKNWEPGKEYTKNIPIKNVHVKTQRIHYSVPTLQVFSSSYPKPVSLSSGTSHVIAVSFKPVERGVYSDKIVIQTEEGDLEIPIKATLPVPKIELVETVQFGMVAITDTNSVFFKIRNSSDVSLKFNFEVPQPFTISPKHGNLSPRKECQLTCTFTPTTASVYAADAICYYEDCRRKLELMGTGKFTYIEVESTNGSISRELDFRHVAMGQSITRTIILSNKSPVTAPFKVRPLWGQKGPISPFSCSDLVGRIGASEMHKLKISFSPKTLGGPFIEYLSIECVGSLTETTIKCVGSAIKPAVTLSVPCVEFNSVQCGSSANRVVEIHNSSSVATLFQFMNAEQTVFSVMPCSGRIPANSRQNLTVSFAPTDPLPYYRRLVCLVHYQEPLFIDVLGAGTTDAVNPVILKQEHLRIYEQRWLKGLAAYPPDQLKIWMREKYISISGTEIQISQNAPFLQETLDFQPTPVDKYSYEYIFTPDYMSQFILDSHEINFGSAAPSADQPAHTILATNLSKGVINCVWIVPKGSRDTFRVSPSSCELTPGASYEFRVLFSPSQLNKYYDSTIECYGYFKALKDYHLVEKEFVSPSWCSAVKLSGNTWEKGGENSPSSLVWDAKQILFSPSLPNSNSYKTITLSNKLDVPIQFNFRPFENDCFEILPKLGLLSEENQIFILKMKSPPLAELSTKLPSLVSTTLTCDINHDLRNPEKLILCGTIESPNVIFPDGNNLFFHPCVVEGRVDQGLRVRNTSMLALQFDWSTQGAAPGVTQITPQTGTIQPNEIQTHTWVFTPKTEGRHSFRGIITTSFASCNSDQRHRQSISIVGDCCKSELFVSDKQVDLGNITVRSNHKESITVINPCPCHLTYTLYHKALYTANGDTETCGPKEIQLPREKSIITAGSRHSIDLILKPEHQGVYSVEVSYQIVTEKKQAMTTQSLLTVVANVCYPSISVVDAKLCSVASSVSKQRIWEMLNIDSLNSLLGMAPSYDEMRYDIATRHSMKRKIPVLTRAIVDFNFGSAPIDSPDSEIILLLENPSSVCVEYAFQFPNDMYLEPEYWADTGELDQFEAKELYLMENSIFSVDKKSGSLSPGERASIKCSHKHTLAGESILPVLLKIRRGREVLLNFKGITSQLSVPHVNFTSDTFHFRPIPVGLLLPPLQAYKIFNGGDAGSFYELDTSPLIELIQQTNGLQVLDCLNPSGHIPAYGYTELLFLFTPPEPIQYSVDMLLKFEGDTKLLTFIAEGFTMDETSKSNSVLLPYKQEITKVPTKQLIHFETEIAVLSSNTISFKHLPLFSPARRITFLRNNSDRNLSFEWEIPSDRISEVLAIKPQNGYLHPNQSISCQVLFLSMVDPSFYDVTIRCVITDESSVLVYKHELAEWEKQQNEKQHMFTISTTQREIKPQKKDAIIVKRHNSLPPLEQESYEDWIRKDMSKKSKHRPRKPKETGFPKPTPPSPFSLELCVNARTHSIADYCSLFPDDKAPFIDTNEIISAMQPADTDIPMNRSVSRLLTSMLSLLIHNLIHDTSFVTCLSAIDREPIPYFVQLQQQPSKVERTEQFETVVSTPEEEHIPEPHKPVRAESAPTRLSGSKQLETGSTPSCEQLDKLKQQENINILLEGILENSIRCIIGEASTNEIDITAKPHKIVANPAP